MRVLVSLDFYRRFSSLHQDDLPSDSFNESVQSMYCATQLVKNTLLDEYNR